MDIATIVALRALATALVLGLGFSAVSDDDYARVVIAQQFAAAPHADPSGTSWLPFPFWLMGSVMGVVGNDFVVARITTVGLSLLSAAAVWWSARVLGASRAERLLGSALAAVLPHAVWLGAATVPEGFSAVFCLAGAASLASTSPRIRLSAAMLLVAATLSRYETWAVAAVAAAVNGWDAVRQRRWIWAVCAGLCVVGPCAWLLHGIADHGNALFFVSRVVDYRRLIGAGSTNLLSALTNYPVALLREEPHLTALGLAIAVAGWRDLTTGAGRLLLCMAALLAMLIWGDVRDGAPTHHPERALLFFWLGACLLIAPAWMRLWARRRQLAVTLLIASAGACVARPWITARQPFVDRSAELQLGRLARTHVSRSERLLIDTGDYGYFAVIAGFADPERATGLVDSDPRQPQLTFEGPRRRIEHHLRQTDARWLVTRQTALDQLGGLGTVREMRGELVLVDVGSHPSR